MVSSRDSISWVWLSREFPFFAFAHQGGKLVQASSLPTACMLVVFTEYGVCGGDGDLLAVLVAGDYSTGYGTGIDLHQAASENYGFVTR